MTPEEIEKMKSDLKSANDRLAAIQAEKDKKKDEDDDEDDEDDDDKSKSKSKKSKKSEDDDDLNDKVRKDRDAKAQRGAETKKLENALKFNLSINEFAKTNSDLLPGEIPEILKAAEKENYESEENKAKALKVSFVKAFFALQANVDFLTENQKVDFAEYQKLTKEGKEERVDEIYKNVFEPAFETLKRVKKAEEVSKSRTGGLAVGDKASEAYIQKIAAGSRKAYLGEKGEK